MAHDPDAIRQEYARQKEAHNRGDDLHAKSKPPNFTHIQLAQLYLTRFGQDTMYTRGSWYRYQNGVWNALHDLLFSQEIWRLLEEHQFNGAKMPSLSTHNSVSACIKARLFISENDVDTDSNLINLTNGVFHLEKQKLLPHSPYFRLTTQLPFEYDPDATAPKWQRFLRSTFVFPKSTEFDEELANFLSEAVGYSLTTSVHHHTTFWCYGEGSNGKGVLFHILQQLAGTASIPLNVGLLKKEQYQLATLAGKRIALCSEAASTKNLVEDALIKALVGGDTMSVRQIRREPFILHPTCKLWWSMNALPAVSDTSEGFWRRVRVLPFNRHFSLDERILDLKYEIEEELPGIFNWAMAGLMYLQARGRFLEPTQVVESTARYREESNPIALFIKDEYQKEQDAKIGATMIYDNYKSWCYRNTFRAMSSKRFRHEMDRLGFFSKRIAAGIVYTGLISKLPYHPENEPFENEQDELIF